MISDKYIVPIRQGIDLIKQLLVSEFNLVDEAAESLSRDRIKKQLDALNDTCYLFAETHYVDKVYRDSYYHYYSSKSSRYVRECIRVSIFEGEITDAMFRDSSKLEDLQERYRGFIVLRPTTPFIIGRSVVSPRALKNNTFMCCSTKVKTTVNSIKFEIEGFPHSSQDTETISCAETTLWAVMEYFSSKYSEYKPVLPSKVIQALSKIISERQLPSKGLNIQQMSFGLKEFGFGTRIYSKSDYGDDFESLISCYIESGLPLIVAIDNRPGNIGHAILCIGHDRINERLVQSISANKISNKKLLKAIQDKKLEIYDYDTIQKEFVFIDDNCPVYQKAFLDRPTNHYSSSEWSTCRIRHFIVPLYPKIYLEAYEAKSFVLKFLVQGPKPIEDNKSLLIRFYLTSSRSFKHALALNRSFDSDASELVLEMAMPKFIWVAELSNKSLIIDEKADGLVVLDATEANIYSNKPLILGIYQGNLIKFDSKSGKLESNSVNLPPFLIYKNNLKNL